MLLTSSKQQIIPEKRDQTQVEAKVENPAVVSHPPNRNWLRSFRLDEKGQCIVISCIQAVFSVVFCVTPLIDIFYFSEHFVRRMGIFLGTFLVPTMVTVNTMLYILDISMQGFFLYALKDNNTRFIQIITIYSVFSPMVEATRVIICINFEFIAEVLAFTCALSNCARPIYNKWNDLC